MPCRLGLEQPWSRAEGWGYEWLKLPVTWQGVQEIGLRKDRLLPPEQRWRTAVNPRMVNNRKPAKNLFLMIDLNFQLHLPDGFQQGSALFETGFAQVA